MSLRAVPALLMLVALVGAAVPALFAYELCSFRWECRRSGPHAGECRATPMLGDRLHLRSPRDVPSTVQLEDIREAVPLADGVLFVPPYHTDVFYGLRLRPDGRAVPDEEARAVAADLNDYLRTPSRDVFVVHPRAELVGGWAVAGAASYTVALLAFVAGVALLRRRPRSAS